MVKKLDEKQQAICKEAGTENPEVLETAMREKDVKTLNKAIAILKDFLDKLDKENKENKENKEKGELTTALINSLQESLKAIQQREQTKKQLNTGKNKPKNTVEELFNNLKSLEKEGAIVSWLSQPQGKEQEKQIITNKDALDVTKKTIQVKFKDGTELHVNPTGISVPDPNHINEKSISQIAKTIQAAGMQDVTIHKEAFPETDRDKLVQQLTDELKKLKINVVNKPEKTQEKEEKKDVEQKDTEVNTLKK